ncbi:helix-turn-helix domain-containing protein [Paenibacillus sp. S28]|uniref:helix-turn-helix domain-containing protein n=1 Tax=Paenibacillus sp. S28 TaxID=2767463 RepID=UPI00190B6196|nr:helix-turn-helix domain-containing protein [Paenibacillus sp. S28]MBJ9990987.1 AraC family transcriptional regulator [Paenibacillus sp. S28]
MDNRTWYKRFLLSNLSILFISGTIVIAIVFSVAYGNVSKETEKESRTYVEQVVDGMTTRLKNIELMLAGQTVNNDAINDFFNGSANASGLVNYKASNEIAKMRSNLLIQSVYFYRYKDGLVLTGGYAAPIDDFTDKTFIQSVPKATQNRWSPIRLYSEFPLIDPPERVISIVKNSRGNEGIIVLNVKVDKLLSMAGSAGSGQRSFLDIADVQGSTVFSTEPAAQKTKPTTYLESDYIGLKYASGPVTPDLFGQAAVRSLAPLSILIPSLLAILAYIMFVTRRNYRPIENIVRRISDYRHETKPNASDEFSIIEQVFDNMLGRMNLIDRQEAENAIMRRKRFFYELQEEDTAFTASEWEDYARLFRMPEKGGGITVAIVEIDKYVPLMRGDRQQLLEAKHRLETELGKRPELAAMVAGSDWIAGGRLALLVNAGTDSISGTIGPDALMDGLRSWVQDAFPFSVTIGIGSVVDGLPEAKTSFREALAALQYKMTAGNNRVIVYSEIKNRENRVDTDYYKWAENLIHHFRLPAPAWRSDLDRIFGHLEERLLKEEELRLLLNDLTHRFARLIEELPPALQELWHAVSYSSMAGALRETGSVAEIRELYESLIGELYDQYAAILDKNSTNPVIYEVKKYIEDHFANPELSLNLISDRFGMNGKYASQLFKEQFGVKFVDFLIGLRVERAQKLLRETELTIGDISRQVGYEHAISFGRVFKKTVGVSPGDYRKLMQPSRIPEEV